MDAEPLRERMVCEPLIVLGELGVGVGKRHSEPTVGFLEKRGKK